MSTATGTQGELTFERTLDRRLVHRAAVSGVLLTSLSEESGETWLAGFQLSRQHVGRAASSRVPVHLGAEVLRQSGLAIAHSHFHVPLDTAFLIDELAFLWAAGADPYFPTFGPLTGVCKTRLVSESKRRGITFELSLEFELQARDAQLAHGSGRLRCVTADQYRVLRRSAPRPLDLPLRRDAALLKDVVTSTAGLTGTLSWDHTDAFYFDHPTDHVPGMVLVGAMSSAAGIMLDGDMPSGFSASFLRFVEFGPDAAVVASAAEEASQVHVEVRQNGVVAASGDWIA